MSQKINYKKYKFTDSFIDYINAMSINPNLALSGKQGKLYVNANYEKKFGHDYKLDEAGFRNNDNETEFDIGCFGCSVTYGDALDNKDIWPTLLQAELGLVTRNFGRSGVGHENISDIFAAAAMNYNFDKAIILLPHNTRFMTWISTPKDEFHDIKRYTLRVDLIGNPEFKYVKPIYENLPPDHFSGSFHRSICYIDMIAKMKGISVLYGSWSTRLDSEMETYNDLLQMSIDVLPLFHRIDRAVDNAHPGKQSHEQWVRESLEQIKNKFNI